MKIVLIILSIVAITLPACRDKTPETQVDPLPPPLNLTKKEADLRKQQISEVSYQLHFDIKKHQKNYVGQSNIRFNYSGVGDTLMIDFYNGKINDLTLNGQKVDYDYDRQAIILKTLHLNQGFNTLNISFQHDFSTDGYGLYKYQDPEDNRIYLYTHLEPFFANTVFPCFDQPNLKATYEMKVTVDPDWYVITSIREEAIQPVDDGRHLWLFPQSDKFSTYIWSLHAGPYHVWEDKTFRYPLRLFSRQSIAQYVKDQNWFTWTKQGFDFYEKYFDYPFPYLKYDQLIVPDFNGAMENVAAVTFGEHFISRTKQTEAERLYTASVIFHEMAHTWFGNLVTMNWWDDLWLKESFATFMEPLALSSVSSLKKKAWISFFELKLWAYWSDQQLTTHPIQVPVEDIATAMTIFDGITYGKGSASLKQLMYFITEDHFKQGIRQYFKTYARKNTELSDFMDALAKAADQDLTPWTNSWLKTAGFNHIIVDLLCDHGKVSSLVFHQKAPIDHPTLRTHSTLLGFLFPVRQSLKVKKTLRTDISGSLTEIPDVSQIACPSVLYPNYQDYGYFKITLDKISIENLMHSISRVDDALLRMQMWHTLWEMLRSSELTLDQYARIALNALPKEKDAMILKGLLDRIHGRHANSNSVIYYLGKQHKKAKSDFLKEYEPLLWQQLGNADEGSDHQHYWFNALANSVENPSGVNKLASLLEAKHPFPGLHVEQDMRWQIILRLSQTGHKNAADLISKEAKADPSLKGTQSALAATAALPDKKTKRSLLDKVIALDSTYSLAEKKAILNNLFPQTQDAMREDFQSEFFQQLDNFIHQGRPASFLNTFSTLAPLECKSVTLSEHYLNNNKNIPPALTKALLINQYEHIMCGKIIAANKKHIGGAYKNQ